MSVFNAQKMCSKVYRKQCFNQQMIHSFYSVKFIGYLLKLNGCPLSCSQTKSLSQISSCLRISSLNLKKKLIGVDICVFQEEPDKEARKTFHNAIKSAFPMVSSETITQDGNQWIRVSYGKSGGMFSGGYYPFAQTSCALYLIANDY